MSWHTGRLALFDIESTGVDPHRDRIVTAAAITAGGGLPTETRDVFVNPGIPIPDGATEVHGITTAQAVAEGADPAVEIPGLAEHLLELSRVGLPIVGHNVVYDLTMLWAECHRHGRTDLAQRLQVVAPVVDTGIIEKHLDPYRPGSEETNRGRRPLEAVGTHNLIDCCRIWGVPLTEQDAHGAAADAIAAGRLAWRLAADPNRLSQFDGPRGVDRISPAVWPLDRLHAWQAERYAAEAARFQSYKRGEQRRKPDEVDPSFVAPTEWPVQPPPTDWAPEQLPLVAEAVA